ncbi:LCP family protein [Tissierella pigra]|uniref:LytR family transcriptional regulator n=1 Tax=Tissierella pigra TaxID=2607614 RepID=A0A6N7XUE7_9FIRM|nr:LCP family protein [Tissierella pigra]MSU01053.1 LytR family transcriptional regulator [Tissierella pigra]
MRTFSKVFILSFICFLMAISIGSYSYVKEKDIKLETNIDNSMKEQLDISKKIMEKLETEPKEPEVYSTLKEAVEKSNRINFLVMGLEDVRTDTIIFASFCPDTKKMNLMNIPRDTYIHRKGYNTAEQRKINSIYEKHGVTGVKKTVSYILDNVPIHHYVMLDYEGVEKIVDSLGGVEVNVPIHMKYKDPTGKPPLEIDIQPGNQILDGKKSLEFLRYRKGNNNKGGYRDGDLGRIKAQQEFMSSFISKASDNMLTVITKGFKHVKTDISLVDSLSWGRKAIGMTKEDFEMITLPGKPEFRRINKKVLSYFIYDKKEARKLLEEIYNVDYNR